MNTPATPDDRLTDSEWIDALLRHDASLATPVVDDGFTRRVIDALPRSRQRSPHGWIIAVMALLGFVIGLGVLSGGEVLTFVLTGLARSGTLTIEHLLLAAIPLGVLYWLALRGAWQET